MGAYTVTHRITGLTALIDQQERLGFPCQSAGCRVALALGQAGRR
ncbi:hypothetical protein ACFWYW_38735 [Nonomuraea sp. NPDC059023]